jgi:hypothetical protein
MDNPPDQPVRHFAQRFRLGIYPFHTRVKGLAQIGGEAFQGLPHFFDGRETEKLVHYKLCEKKSVCL